MKNQNIRILVLIYISSIWCSINGQSNLREQDFKNPPSSTRPRTWIYVWLI